MFAVFSEGGVFLSGKCAMSTLLAGAAQNSIIYAAPSECRHYLTEQGWL